MSTIIIDEKNKQRIQKYIKNYMIYYGYENDVALLEKNQLTKKLAIEIFERLMAECEDIRKFSFPDKRTYNEFEKLITTTYTKYDSISKPVNINMNFEALYYNIQIAFEMIEVENLYIRCRDLRNVTNTVINSIDKIGKYNIDLSAETKKNLEIIADKLRHLLSEDKTNFSEIEKWLAIYNLNATEIWHNYLTDVFDSENKEFRWLIHNITRETLKGDFNTKYMSTSLMTNNMMGVFGNNRYGLIIKPKHIVCASYKDTYTINSKEEDIFHVRPFFMLPQEIEEICIKQTINANGEMLNYSQALIYPEIVVDEYEIIGIYYLSNGEHELAPNYNEAKKLAEEKGLPLIERDLSKYRSNLGLEPITKTDRAAFFKNILYKCCQCCHGDENLETLYARVGEEFLQKKGQEFYEKYLKLKQLGNLSTIAILKSFAEVIRNDLYSLSLRVDEIIKFLEEREKLKTCTPQDNQEEVATPKR